MLLTARRVGAGLWLIAALLSCLALGFAVAGDLSVVRLWRHILHWRVGNESWLLLQRALELLPPDGADLYRVVYFEHGIKLSYPPSALLLWQAAASACRQCSAQTLMSTLNAIGLWLTLAIPVVTSAELLGGRWARGASRADRALIVAGVVLLCAAYYPLALANALGQVQAWLNALFAVAFWAFSRQRHIVSGVVLGVMVLVKPYAALLVLWAALRGHRRLVLAALATIGAGLAVSLAIYGVDSHFGYFRMAAVLSERGESMYANQSINGLLNRLFLAPEQIRWEHTAPPPYHPAVAIGTMAALVSGTATAFWWPRRWVAAGTSCDLAFAVVIMLIGSPIGWEHYYAMLLPLYAIFLAETPARADRTEIALVLASTVLTGMFLAPVARIESRPWSILQSYQLAGAVLFLLALARRIRVSGARRLQPAA